MEQFKVKVKMNENKTVDAFVYVIKEAEGYLFSLSLDDKLEFEKSIKTSDGNNFFYKFENYQQFYEFTLKNGLLIEESIELEV